MLRAYRDFRLVVYILLEELYTVHGRKIYMGYKIKIFVVLKTWSNFERLCTNDIADFVEGVGHLSWLFASFRFLYQLRVKT